MRTNESYLRWQFGRWAAKGYTPNVGLLGDNDRPGVALEPGETAIAQIALRSNGTSLLLTNARLIRADETLVRFAEVRYCDWIDRDRAVAARLKTSKFQRIIIELRDGREVIIDGLGQAVFPLLKFFWFKLDCRRLRMADK